MEELSEAEILARRIENAAKLANPINELFRIADEVRKTELEEPSDFDFELLKLTGQLVDAINDLRGRIRVLEGKVFE